MNEVASIAYEYRLFLHSVDPSCPLRPLAVRQLPSPGQRKKYGPTLQAFSCSFSFVI